MSEYWLCVGGANVDVQGVTIARLLPGTSNPGHVQQAAGGVARNVAENLGWLGQEVQLFSLVGEDADGELEHNSFILQTNNKKTMLCSLYFFVFMCECVGMIDGYI